MRLTIVAVGKVRNGPIVTLYDSYASRLPWPVDLHEIDVRKADPGQQSRREGERLLAALPKGALVIALDAGGRMLDSEALATKLADWRDESRRLRESEGQLQ